MTSDARRDGSGPGREADEALLRAVKRARHGGELPPPHVVQAAKDAFATRRPSVPGDAPRPPPASVTQGHAMNDTPTRPRELAFRLSDGIEVALLWLQETDELTVAVVDARSGHAFALAVGNASPLDVFYHPYWHAALRAV